jgi:hypothetical protein
VSVLLLDRYDTEAVVELFRDAGVLAAVEAKGFERPRVALGEVDSPLVHVCLHAWKQGAEHLLFDGCLTEARLAVDAAGESHTGLGGVSLVVVFWVREQDPTAAFSAQRPRLPLQDHPGLGLLKRVFHIGVRIGCELGKDGIAAYPKLPHDAVLFFRSRLFLFLRGAEQGRFEALWRDLGRLGLRDLSLAVSAGAVRDENGGTVAWAPGLQVHPLSERLLAHFHSEAYAREVGSARATARYSCDSAVLEATIAMFEARSETQGEQHVSPR